MIDKNANIKPEPRRTRADWTRNNTTNAGHRRSRFSRCAVVDSTHSLRRSRILGSPSQRLIGRQAVLTGLSRMSGRIIFVGVCYCAFIVVEWVKNDSCKSYWFKYPVRGWRCFLRVGFILRGSSHRPWMTWRGLSPQSQNVLVDCSLVPHSWVR